MNHPPPVNEKIYRKITNVFNINIKQVAERLMSKEANELRGDNDTNAAVDVGGSLDGTWQKRQ